MSDTPRTESEVSRPRELMDDILTVDANFACQLERELTAANERIKRLEDIIKRAGCKFFEDGSDGKVAVNMLTVLDEAREAKP